MSGSERRRIFTSDHIDLKDGVVPITDFAATFNQRLIQTKVSGPVVITQRGEPGAVVVSIGDYVDMIDYARRYLSLTDADQE